MFLPGSISLYHILGQLSRDFDRLLLNERLSGLAALLTVLGILWGLLSWTRSKLKSESERLSRGIGERSIDVLVDLLGMGLFTTISAVFTTLIITSDDTGNAVGLSVLMLIILGILMLSGPISRAGARMFQAAFESLSEEEKENIKRGSNSGYPAWFIEAFLEYMKVAAQQDDEEMSRSAKALLGSFVLGIIVAAFLYSTGVTWSWPAYLNGM